MSSTLGRLALMVRTVRHLRAEQIAWRILRRFRSNRPPAAPTGEVRLASGASGVGNRWLELEGTLPDPGTAQRARLLEDGVVWALGARVPLADIRWTTRCVSQLWTYHLHYFETLVPLYLLGRKGSGQAVARTVELVEGWIRATSEGEGEGWDPYPTSVRIVEWLKVLAMDEAEGGGHLPPGTRQAMLVSLHRQAAHLDRHLEWDLGSNHLLKNLCALIWAGALLDGADAERMLQRAHGLLRRELDRQVLGDGMHEERSPAYHQLVLHDLLEVRALLAALDHPGGATMEGTLARMLTPVHRMTRSDGSFFLFGDSANGSAPARERVLALAEGLSGLPPESPGRSPWSLPEAGFHGYRDPTYELVLDCGPFGPPHQPAHGHCDALSFEFDVAGLPVVVDSGVHGYAGDPYREYSRSTRAHNTVQVEGGEQSEVWALFRVARRAVVRVLSAPRGGAGGEGEGPLFEFRGSCAPYHALHVVHERTFHLKPGVLEIHDHIHDSEGRGVQSFLHLHPRWKVEPAPGGFVASDGERVVEIGTWGFRAVDLVQGSMDPVQGWYLPSMGTAVEAAVIIGSSGRGGTLDFGFTLTDWTAHG